MKQDISYRNIMRVAFPMIIGGMGHVSILVGDTIMLGRVGPVELGAAGNAGLLYLVCVMVGRGFTTGTQIIIGRRNGEGNYGLIGNLCSQSLYCLLFIGVCFYVFLQYGSPLLMGAIAQSTDIASEATTYLQMRSWGIMFSMVNALFVGFFTGIARTFVLSVSMIIMGVVNIVLDYCLIFGEWGFPEMNVEGAALAAVIAEVSALLFYIVYTLTKVDLPKYQIFQFFKPNWSQIRKIINISGPVMMQNFITMGAWFAFFSIIEHIGERELAISHIVRGVYGVMIIPVFAFSNATSTLVSNLIGQGDRDKVMQLIWRSVLLGTGVCFVFMQPNLWIPEKMMAIFTNDASLAAAAIPTLYIVTAVLFMFNLGFILLNSLIGTGKTMLALYIELINIAIYLAFCYVAVFKFDASVEVAWSSEFVYFGFMTPMCYLYLKYGKWGSVNI